MNRIVSPHMFFGHFDLYDHDAPRQDPQHIGPKRLIEIPSWSCREEYGSELVVETVEDIAVAELRVT